LVLRNVLRGCPSHDRDRASKRVRPTGGKGVSAQPGDEEERVALLRRLADSERAAAVLHTYTRAGMRKRERGCAATNETNHCCIYSRNPAHTHAVKSSKNHTYFASSHREPPHRTVQCAPPHRILTFCPHPASQPARVLTVRFKFLTPLPHLHLSPASSLPACIFAPQSPPSSGPCFGVPSPSRMNQLTPPLTSRARTGGSCAIRRQPGSRTPSLLCAGYNPIYTSNSLNPNLHLQSGSAVGDVAEQSSVLVPREAVEPETTLCG
jgi:hypothetical protein